MAPSLVSEPKEESVAQDEAGTETVPSSKKSKMQILMPSADNFDAKSPMEDVDADEIVEAAGEEEMANKDEVAEHQSVPVDSTNQENKAQSEVENRDKSKDVVELIDEGPLIEVDIE
uniref:Uncharacterized protein n=1 Tax=Ananas comosus var. bracteatus TaxID=296719 RepID=A0A6V7NYW1_ANACO|nr:unnamed protein product [Ananas comosus var. bracteatus]